MDQTAAPPRPTRSRRCSSCSPSAPRPCRSACASAPTSSSRNPDRVAVSTVAELAAAADVQPSALMRFCQELGFSGFSADAAPVPRRVLPQVARLLDPPAEPARRRREPPRGAARRVRRGRPRLAREADDHRRPRHPRARRRHPGRRLADPPRRLPPLLPGRELPRLRLREDGDPLRAALRPSASSPPATRVRPRRRRPRDHLRPLQRRDRRLRRGRPRRRPPGRRHHRQPVEPAAAPRR